MGVCKICCARDDFMRRIMSANMRLNNLGGAQKIATEPCAGDDDDCSTTSTTTGLAAAASQGASRM